MDRMEHFHGKLIAGDQVLFDDVDGYLGSHDLKKGMKSYFGYFELPTEKCKGMSSNECYRLVLDDGRAGMIFADVHPSNAPGRSVAEFHVTGAFKK